MNKEDKELLFKDLCTRLPYGVNVQYEGVTRKLWSIALDETILLVNNRHVEKCKPYLRPIDSMTKEECDELEELTNGWLWCDGEDIYPIGQMTDADEFHFIVKGFDWLNAHHFDYRGLIYKGLALEAPKGMYNN